MTTETSRLASGRAAATDPPRYSGLICDLDGTVYLSGTALPGSIEALHELRAAGVRVLFVTNNPLRDAESYAERLTGLGYPCTAGDILTSGGVTASWVQRNLPGARALVLGEESLRAELVAAGVTIVERVRGLLGEAVEGEFPGDPSEVDLVVASFDRTFAYDAWTQAFRAIKAGARFIATNPDPTCPVAGGEIPDCGGIVAALERSTGEPVEHVMGKPSPLMVEAALRRLMLDKEDVLLVGDRLGTDIEMAHRAGIDSALVLTGISNRDEAGAAARRPAYILESLADVPSVVLPG